MPPHMIRILKESSFSAFCFFKVSHLLVDLGVNSIDIKNLGPVFGTKLGPIVVLYFHFYISGQFWADFRAKIYVN